MILLRGAGHCKSSFSGVYFMSLAEFSIALIADPFQETHRIVTCGAVSQLLYSSYTFCSVWKHIPLPTHVPLPLLFLAEALGCYWAGWNRPWPAWASSGGPHTGPGSRLLSKCCWLCPIQELFRWEALLFSLCKRLYSLLDLNTGLVAKFI